MDKGSVCALLVFSRFYSRYRSAHGRKYVCGNHPVCAGNQSARRNGRANFHYGLGRRAYVLTQRHEIMLRRRHRLDRLVFCEIFHIGKMYPLFESSCMFSQNLEASLLILIG